MFPYPVVESSLRGPSSSDLPRSRSQSSRRTGHLNSDQQWRRTTGTRLSRGLGSSAFPVALPGLSSPAAPGALHLGCKGTSCPPRSPGCQGDNLNSLVPRAWWSGPIYLPTPTPVPRVHRQVLPSQGREAALSSALGRGAPRPQEGSTRRRPAPTGQPCPAPPGRRAHGPGTAWPCAHGGDPPSAPGRAEGVRGSQACGGESQDQLRA